MKMDKGHMPSRADVKAKSRVKPTAKGRATAKAVPAKAAKLKGKPPTRRPAELKANGKSAKAPAKAKQAMPKQAAPKFKAPKIAITKKAAPKKAASRQSAAKPVLKASKPMFALNGKGHRERETNGHTEQAILNGGGARAPGVVGTNGTAAARNGAAKDAAKRSEIVLAPGYRPSDAEPFMNQRHRSYFRSKLLAWKEEIVKQNKETLQVLHDDSGSQADPADRATHETDRALELRARDRQRKLMGKIEAALARIEEGSYGYCEETGEPISLKRLDARPIATLSLEAQERRERRERVFRED